MTSATTSTAADSTELSNDDMDFIKELVRSKIAVQLEGKAYLIESRLAPVVRLHGLSDLRELVGQVRTRSNRPLETDVVEAMTTNETSFFRDQTPFTALAERIIPDLLKNGNGGGPFTMWNAASSSGQESLSVAMMLHEQYPEMANSRRTRLLATDVSRAMVVRCQEAIYSRFEINRGLPANYALKYFDKSGRNWAAKKILTDLIEARELNLINPWAGVPRCDVVMLRNVLIYFPLEIKADILRRIRTDVLKPSGCLLLGGSESTAGIDAAYTAERVNGSTIFFPTGGA